MKKSRQKMYFSASRQSGFSLFEVLITMVVSLVGLMSLAALQAAGIRSNQSAYQGSQATVLAYDIADKMRANTGSINNYLTSYMTPDAASAQAGCNTTGGCTAAELAENDLFDWHADLVSALPSATGTITLDGAIYTVSVNWDDNRDGAVDADDAPFQVSFQP
jgi:type IV pilus assembly protein PilV